MKDKVFYEESGGGVTFSGGEPMMQTAFLVDILQKLRDQNIHTTIDTSGYAPEKIFKKVTGLTDLILFDLKIIDNKNHKKYTGTDNSLVHYNLNYLIEKKIPFRIRIPLVNGLTAEKNNLEETANMLKGKGEINIDLLSYHDLGKGKQEKSGVKNEKMLLTAPSREQLEEIRDMFESCGFNVNLGG